MDAQKTAITAAEAALSKKAIDIEIIDVSTKVDYAQYLVLCSARVERQVRAIADEIEIRLKKKKVRPLGTEGMQSGSWVLMDYGDVVIHVFHEDAREYYDLDSLWMDAERLSIPPEPEE